jgi:hypothetical protein
VLFSFENVSNIESIHEQEPIEDSNFVGAAGVPYLYKGLWRLDIFVLKVIKF